MPLSLLRVGAREPVFLEGTPGNAVLASLGRDSNSVLGRHGVYVIAVCMKTQITQLRCSRQQLPDLHVGMYFFPSVLLGFPVPFTVLSFFPVSL